MKKKLTKILFVVAIIIALILLATSCKKKSVDPVITNNERVITFKVENATYVTTVEMNYNMAVISSFYKIVANVGDTLNIINGGAVHLQIFSNIINQQPRLVYESNNKPVSYLYIVK